MVQRRPLPPQLLDRPFLVGEAREAGVSRARTRASDLGRPFRGVRTPAQRQTIRMLCEAYAVRMPPSQHFSHATAAQLCGLPLPRRLGLDADIAVTAQNADIHVSAVGSREPRMLGVRGHLAQTNVRVRVVGGLSVSHPVDTWCALASTLGLTDLVKFGDALVRRKGALATMGELREAVKAFRGHRGVRRLAAALELVRPGTDSAAETEIRLMIVRGGLPDPAVNAVIRGTGDGFLALGDIVYLSYRVLVEYDGSHHFESEGQMHHDIDRLDAVMAAKWRVIRFNKTHLRREEYVVSTVRKALLDGGWRP